jgi:exodeoxyribonuclease-1
MFVCSPNSDNFKLSPTLIEKFQLNLDKCLKNLRFIQQNSQSIEDKIRSIYANDSDREPSRDVDQSIYDGFISNNDRKICNDIQNLSPTQLSEFVPEFEDRRLTKLFLNFKARNYPQLLNEFEQEQWFEIVQSRIQSGANGFLSIDSFERSIESLRETQPGRENLWKELEDYAQSFI